MLVKNLIPMTEFSIKMVKCIEDPAPFTSVTSSIFDKIMAVNVKGVWLNLHMLLVTVLTYYVFIAFRLEYKGLNLRI
jgi:hypothetical protein